ncbi:unnamed protein product [Rotaria socialis]|uniref:Uncharacterized protein n=1 Tax=Rotaria socialis TaxID=392032 RepID=A0A821MN58_9BILA|nr:unnamed protein product [Rotaria socialis]CAF3322489.1 unnamed protein product [Rotaria socialis]CAF3467023.1 unnamed protein product [Rotaria socialis]CAF3490811.1 unnamed protein product [Rotaria socialis]CAF3729181.1 unnamed protein product [Rotaria socialis]
MESLVINLLLLLFLTPCYIAFSSSSSSSKNGQFHYTHNKQQLNTLYNKPIQSIQEYSRPLQMPGGNFLNKLGINHRGQVATYEDGQRFLVHKGKNFGKNSQTVTVDARYMSNNWSPRGSPVNVHHEKSVNLGDLVKSGGAHYSPICDNCIHGSQRMQERFRNGK